jgi:hypothetical protein
MGSLPTIPPNVTAPLLLNPCRLSLRIGLTRLGGTTRLIELSLPLALPRFGGAFLYPNRASRDS